MKHIKFITLLFIATVLMTSCSEDDTINPTPINEEEVITTMKIVLTPTTGTVVTLESKDLDGDGPNCSSSYWWYTCS